MSTQIVILAAGMGSRLGRSLPKPLTEQQTSTIVDTRTAEQIGDFIVLEWRGKRRQILYRPD